MQDIEAGEETQITWFIGTENENEFTEIIKCNFYEESDACKVFMNQEPIDLWHRWRVGYATKDLIEDDLLDSVWYNKEVI